MKTISLLARMHIPRILLTNDDGIRAGGIWYLYKGISKSFSVTVVAPEGERSGIGHAFTINRPLHYKRICMQGTGAFSVSGTPVDCVKFAISYLLKPVRPDAVVSGLNIGENSGLSAFYSGTVAAAREGAFWNIPSIAFSLCEEGRSHVKEYIPQAVRILRWIMKREKEKKKHIVFYNVNFPSCAPEKARGIKITVQSMAFFDDRYEAVNVKQRRLKKGYVIYGDKRDLEQSNKYDSFALKNNYITVTPLNFNATASVDYREMCEYKKGEW